ncbi:MAG: helix-turn-helix transcriptional regulator [Bacteroidetes bacterium]|nr:helix-turn-helix transcriptional regulator [Bacteroidota bacterium]
MGKKKRSKKERDLTLFYQLSLDNRYGGKLFAQPCKINNILDYFCQVRVIQMLAIGTLLRNLRIKNGLLLRQVAAEIEIDQALLSKIERCDRIPSKEQVIRLARYYKVDEDELVVAFLSDKLVYEVRDEELGLQAMQVAEQKINYIIKNRNEKL